MEKITFSESQHYVSLFLHRHFAAAAGYNTRGSRLELKGQPVAREEILKLSTAPYAVPETAP